jgi:dipeptidyl aminopeptidase/acylaminoacyl peptidase
MMQQLTPELLADLRVPSDPQISPDGQRIAFAVGSTSRRDEHDVSALWLADARGLTPARQITSGFTHDTAPRWSPDGSRIAFLSDRKQRGTQQVHLLPIDGGEAQPLTDERGGVRDVQWLAGAGSRLAYLVADARSEAEEQRRGDERDDANVYGEFWGFSRLHLRDLELHKTRVVDLGERHVNSIAPSDDGSRLAAILWKTPELDGWMTPSILVIIDCATASPRLSFELPYHASSVVWNRAGDTLYFTASGGATGVSSDQLWSIELREAARPVLLTSGFEYCVADVARGQKRDDLVLNVMAGTESKLYTFTPSSG